MKAIKSKAQERVEIEHQVRFFLRNGGKVQSIEPGISGREIGAYPPPPVSFCGPKEPRTLLLAEVQAIEARKHKPPKPAVARKQPKRVLITDDFGEPLRWSWQDE